MRKYGSDMKGKFYGQSVSTLPIWSSSDERREIYVEDTNKRFYGTSTEWIEYADDNINIAYYTPTVVGSTSGSYVVSGSYDELAYCKIGELCYVSGYLSITGESSPVGNVQISLPFTTGAAVAGFSGISRAEATLLNHGGSFPTVKAEFQPSVAYFYLVSITDAGVSSAIGAADIDSAWDLTVNFVYITRISGV